MPEEIKNEMEDLLACEREDTITASDKTGMGVNDILTGIIERIPPPKGNPNIELQALIFDSTFNSYRGIEVIFRVQNGSIRKGDKVKFVATGKEYNADEIGTLRLEKEPKDVIECGDVGYLISGIKVAREVKVGDIITHVDKPSKEPIEGFEEVKPMVWIWEWPPKILPH